MFWFEDAAERHLTALNYTKKEIKPWNVKEGDILILSDSSERFINTKYIPVTITITDKYADFYRESPGNPNSRISRTSYRFDHKPIEPTDSKHLYGWWHTTWNSLDTVEVWRTNTKSTKSDNPTQQD